MYIEFVATVDDLLDVNVRFLKRGKRRSYVGWTNPFLIGIYVLALLVLFGFRPREWPRIFASEWHFVLLACVLIACQLLVWLLQPILLKNRLRDIIRKKYGVRRPFLVQLEIKPEGFWIKEMGAETTIGWAQIEGIEEGDDSLDVITRHSGMIAVRKRAFGSEEEMDEFMELIQARLEG